MFQNYFKPTPKKLLKLSLGLKAFIGTIAASAYAQSPRAAFWMLVIGAFLDFIIDLQKPDEPRSKSYVERVKMILVLIGCSMLFVSCSLGNRVKTKESSHTDSSYNNKTEVTGISKKDSTASSSKDSTGISKKNDARHIAGDSAISIVTEKNIDTNIYIAGDTTEFQFVPGADTSKFNTPGNTISIIPNGDGSYTVHLVNKPKNIPVKQHEKQTKTGQYNYQEDHQAASTDSTTTSAKDTTAYSATDSNALKASAAGKLNKDAGGKKIETKPPWQLLIICLCILAVIAIVVWWYVRRKKKMITSLTGWSKITNGK